MDILSYKKKLGLYKIYGFEFVIFLFSFRSFNEIKKFSNFVGSELNFQAISYQEFFRCLDIADNAHKVYLDYLRERYFS